MKLPFQTLTKSEQAAYRLRGLYEQYGYRKFSMAKFEEYDFYTQNRDFIPTSQILTFTDLSGKLMALRPDVTLSIVKNTHATPQIPEKLYYSESVYRVSQEVREYREIFQTGLEYIGSVTPYITAELVGLALKSLACLEQSHLLALSHMGFVGGLFDSLAVSQEQQGAFLQCIAAKNAHELAARATRKGLDSQAVDRLLALTRLSGTMEQVLPQARTLAANEKMHRALDELEELYEVFHANGSTQALRADFSVVSDSRYYNGLMMRGHLQSVPRPVLTGGRYDRLPRRMGHEGLQAIGFAVYFDELERYLKSDPAPGVDAVILYDASVSPAVLFGEVERLTAQGKRVQTATQLSPDTAGAMIYRIRDGKLTEVRT